jgi:CRP/FNR family transcriptional regulator, nitrogen fixation regulation protein
MHASASIARRDFQMPAAIRTHGISRVRPVTFHAPETEIYAQGERAGTIYRIEYGAVRIYRLLADGRRQVVAFHVSGETFGFEAGAVHSFFAEAIVQTGLTTVGLDQDGRYPPELMALALKGMVRAQEHLLVVGRQSALEKLAVFLVDLAERQGGLDLIDLPMTRTDIGDYLGMTIETVSRNLSKLREMGILRLKNPRCIEILKAEKLRLLSE